MSETIMPRVVGLDLSLTSTGVAHPDGSTSLIKSKFKDDRRLIDLYMQISAAIRTADFVVLEDLPLHAMSAGKTGQVQGVARLAMRQQEVPYLALSPATLKKAATGKGNAKKPDMKAALISIFAGYADVQQEIETLNDDRVDAYHLRSCGLHLLGFPAPLVHKEALDRYEVDPVVAELREVWA